MRPCRSMPHKVSSRASVCRAKRRSTHRPSWMRKRPATGAGGANNEEDDMGRLSGRAIIVTGAAQGIGAAYARALAAEGARLAVCDVDPPEATVAAIKKAGGEAIGMVCDVTDAAAVGKFVQAAE